MFDSTVVAIAAGFSICDTNRMVAVHCGVPQSTVTESDCTLFRSTVRDAS